MFAKDVSLVTLTSCHLKVLMGPEKTPCYSGCKYTMVLGDDYTRYTWLYFLKEKSEVTHKFVIFSDMVEKEFDAKIKCLRIDNGGEFNSTDFTAFCHEKGIQRQFTCRDTLQ